MIVTHCFRNLIASECCPCGALCEKETPHMGLKTWALQLLHVCASHARLLLCPLCIGCTRSSTRKHTMAMRWEDMQHRVSGEYVLRYLVVVVYLVVHT
jgi:hypothetical protein